MASNMKGLSGVKGLMLRHGEKIAISLVGVIALWLIYKSMSLPHLADQYQAPKLQDEIRQTSSAVRDATWPDKGSELATEVRPYEPINAKADEPVPIDPYKTSPNGFDTTIVAPTVLRTDPVLVNAEEVRGNGGSGLFAFLDENIRKAQELARQLEADERAKKEADRQEKEQKNANAGGPEGGPGGRNNRGGPEGGAIEPFDPDHPNRRPLEGMAQSMGAARQGGERIERAYWACVVAKVPIRAQLKLYQDAFEKARMGFDPARDFPQYKGYLVQRAEVLPGDKPLDWKPVSVYDGQRPSGTNPALSTSGIVSEKVMAKLFERATLFWAGGGPSPDVIDPRFADFVLTMPLPPLIGRDWGAEATHPDIPLIANTPPLEDETAALAAAQAAEEAKKTGNTDEFSSTAPGGVGPGPGPGGMRPGGMGPRGFGAGPGGPGVGMFRGPGGPEGMGPGGSSRMMGMGPEGGGGARSFAGPMAAGAARTSLPKGVDFLLLRFFDFTVEPGKKYKYRVTLVLADANAGMPEGALAPAVLDRHRQESVAAKAKNTQRNYIRRIEAWSEPSPTVGIPLSGNVRLAEVKVPSAEKFNDEPIAKLLVESFDVDEKNNAIQAAKEREFRRGSVANMVDKADYLGDGPWIDVREGFKFTTGMTLLDVDGGKTLGKNMLSPGRVLVMGPAGDMYVRNEIDDKPIVENHRLIFDQKDKHKLGGPEEGPGMPGAGGRPGRPGGGGRGRN